jgi:hypothetical protein
MNTHPHYLWVLPITFVFLAACLIWFLIGARGAWWLKLSLMAVTFMLCVMELRTVEDVYGYPKLTTPAEVKDKTATLYKMVIEEPTAIYLWMRLEGDNDLRAYQLPYSRTLAKMDPGAGGGNGDPERIQFTGGDSNQKGSGSSQTNSGSTEFYVLPPAIVPDKIRSR